MIDKQLMESLKKEYYDDLNHLNSILKITSGINQAIIRIDDKDLLLKEISKILISNHTFDSVWIALYDKNGQIDKVINDGFGKESLVFKEKLLSGFQPYCIKHINQEKLLSIDNTANSCGQCTLKNSYKEDAAIIVKLKYKDRIYGNIGLSIKKEYLERQRDNQLFIDVAENIAFALSNIEMNENKKRVEKALQESERKSQAWIQNSPVCTKIVDLDFNLQFISASGIRELNIDNINEFYGKPYPFDFYPDTAKVELTNALIKAKRTGSIITVETLVLDINGNKKYYETTVVPVDDDIGKLDYLLVVSSETTKRKEAENLLKKNEKILNLIIDKSPIGICTVDLVGNFVSTNPTYEKMLGYSKKELSELSFFDITHPDYRPKNKQLFQKIFSLEASGFNMEKVYIRKDGKEIDVSVHATGVSDETGDIKFGTAFVEDITEKKLAHELLEQKKKELETIIQEAPNPIIIANEDGEVLMVNKVWKTLTGYKYEEINTMEKWTKKAFGENSKSVKEYIDTLYSITDNINNGEFSIRTKDGRNIIWKFNTASLGIINDKRTVISSAMDITELKEQEQILLQQSKMASMGEMMESIAHQWRQPLSVISTASSGLKMQQEFGMLNDKILVSSCDSILNSALHLSETIDDFRDFFKKDKVKSYFEIGDIYHKTFNLLISKFKNRDIEMIENIDKVQLNGFGNELVQVFMNILNNARDELEIKEYSRLIFVDIHQDNDIAIIKIKDNAGGIPKDIIDKVFDSHFTTKLENDGTGIGLYMSKKIIIDSFNGTLEANNTDFKYEDIDYKGAEFTILLPIK